MMSKADSSRQEITRLKKWHRRFGLSAAFFVLMLAITGFFLNHASDWQLDNQRINSPALLSWYGINRPDQLFGYPLGDKLVSKVGDEVFLDTRELAHCGGELTGAVHLPAEELVVIACYDELIVLTEQYELVERLGAIHGLPSPINKIGVRGSELTKGDRVVGGSVVSELVPGDLVIAAGEVYFLADLEALIWSPLENVNIVDSSIQNIPGIAKVVAWSEPVAMPPVLVDVLDKHFVGEGISVERLLLDIHSGRFLGKWGVFLVDVMAVLFVILAVTGFLMWRREAR